MSFYKVQLYLICASLNLSFLGCKNQDDTNLNDRAMEATALSIPSAPITNVIISKAVTKRFDVSYEVNGKVMPYEDIVIYSEVGGLITSFPFREGELVQRGSVLANIDDRDQQLAIATLGVVKQEKSFLRDEQRMLVSGGDFGQDSLLTDQQMDNIDNRVGYNQAAQALDNAKAELRKYTILSPINGVIADREVIQGQWINPGESLCKIYNPKTFEAELYVLENVAIQLLKGQSISIVSISEPKLSTTARITTINPVVNKNGLVKVRAKLASRHNQFYHGMNIKASIKTPTSPSIVIPKEALVNRSNRDVVFTYDRSSGLAQWNYVTVGDINSTHASIIDGLEEGMEVIIEGNLNLGHDANVQVADSESTYE